MSRFAIPLLLALLAVPLVACQSAPAPEPVAETPAQEAAPAKPAADGTFTMCQVPRPQACTREYAPVCAHLSDGSLTTRPNGCTACAEIDIFGYRNGTCR